MPKEFNEIFIWTIPVQQKTHHLIGNVHAVDESYPAHAYCFHISSDGDDTERVVNDVYRLIEFFWARIVPHNLFWTFGAVDGRQVLKIFIFPRMEMHDKMSASLNVAFCELSGYVIVAGKSTIDMDAYHPLIHRNPDFAHHFHSQAKPNTMRWRRVKSLPKYLTLWAMRGIWMTTLFVYLREIIPAINERHYRFNVFHLSCMLAGWLAGWVTERNGRVKHLFTE